jgi:hypothetical protein
MSAYSSGEMRGKARGSQQQLGTAARGTFAQTDTFAEAGILNAERQKFNG